MATLHSVTADKNTLPAGAEAVITVTFDTAPAQGERTAHVTITMDGVVDPIGKLDFTIPAIAAEQVPTVNINAASGWGISCDTGSLRTVAGDPVNTFRYVAA